MFPTTTLSVSFTNETWCGQRDGYHCVFTKDGTKDVAYICPISLNTQGPGSAHDVFWDILRTFWSESKVDSWFKTLFPNSDYRDACHNLLCLSASAHRYFESAYFALKPISISDDEKELVVQFFWLSKGVFHASRSQ